MTDSDKQLRELLDLRNQIEARDPTRLAEVVDVASDMIAERFGHGAVDGKMQANVVAIRK